jgi:hypothetical protein
LIDDGAGCGLGGGGRRLDRPAGRAGFGLGPDASARRQHGLLAHSDRRPGNRTGSPRGSGNRRTGGKCGVSAGAEKQRPATGGCPPELRLKKCQVTASFPD